MQKCENRLLSAEAKHLTRRADAGLRCAMCISDKCRKTGYCLYAY